MSLKKKAEIEVKRVYNDLILWSDESKIDSEAIDAEIAWKSSNIWHEKSLALGYSKEAFDAELFEILEAFKIAVKEEKRNSYTSLTIFSDSQTAILRLLDDKIGPGQTLAAETIRIAEKLTDKGI